MSDIDLRSDTVTVPTEAMRQAMVAAPVGDDVYAEDPTIAALEGKIAELLGHEAGLFCATGSLTNLLGVAQLVEPGQELLCDAQAHVVRAEVGAHGALSGITTRTWPTGIGRLDPDVVMDLAAPDAGPYLVSTAAIAVENTHNFAGGTVQPCGALVELSTRARAAGLKLHLDGARLWNAHVATGIPLSAYGNLFDTVSVCFSKGLGAPVGSMLVASSERIARARVLRKRLGAGWRQAGILAAAANFAVDHQLGRLAEDHVAAQAFAAAVADRHPEAIDPTTVETNIAVVHTGGTPAAEIAARAGESGVALSVVGGSALRAVTHLGVTLEQSRQAGDLVARLLG